MLIFLRHTCGFKLEIPLFNSMRKKNTHTHSNTNAACVLAKGSKSNHEKSQTDKKTISDSINECQRIWFFLDQHPHSLSKNYISITENISQPVNSLTHIIKCEFQNRSVALVIIVFSQKPWYWLLISKNSSDCSSPAGFYCATNITLGLFSKAQRRALWATQPPPKMFLLKVRWKAST